MFQKMTFLLVGAVLFSGAFFPITIDAADCRHIIVTSDHDYPPISWRDKKNPEKIIGVAVEIIEQAFAETDIDIEVKYAGPWKRALLSVSGGEIDLILGLYENQERKADMDYVYPAFMDEPVSVFVITGNGFAFQQWSDLIGKVGGVRAGDSFGTDFDDFARQHLTLESVSGFEQLYKMASADRITYFLYGYYSGLALAGKLGINQNIERLEHPVVMESLYVAFSKKSKCTIHKEFLGKKIAGFVADGLVDDLILKYQDIWEAEARKAGISPAETITAETVHLDH
jgi:polar amino acid transport system substrate-binding protein